ncbi:MAG: type IV secretory system conjugative DNA transfer family protein [Flavobacteriales bacterium]|nr:type IV secretory system conjugative DNA transfer family protein [Flavobacteriales bacterium]
MSRFEEISSEFNVLNPDHGFLIEGKPGSGKSASIIEPIHYQSILAGASGMIYDWKGAFDMTLGKSAYNYWNNAEEEVKSNLQVKFVNYLNPLITSKVNLLELDSIENNLLLDENIDILFKNLEKEWIKKTDFWAQNAISYGKGCAMFLRDYYPEYCDLGHMISLALTDFDVFLEAVIQTEDVQLMNVMKPLITAYKQDAESQISGAVSTTQLPLTSMNNKEIYWVHSAEDPKEYISLDVSNKVNPTLLILGNHKPMKKAITPALSVLMSQITNYINQPGKNLSLFSVDELPTTYIKDLDELPATGRSNKVITLLAIQTFSQLVDIYGKEKADKIRENLGNQIIGRCSPATAKYFSDYLGKVEARNLSYSKNSGGRGENTASKEKSVLQAREIGGQEIGHFTGEISGGKPPFFHAQFEYFDYKKLTGNEIEDIPILNIPKVFKESYEGINDEKNQKKRETKIIDFKEMLLQYYDNKMTENFDRVNENIEKIMQPFAKIAEAKRARKKSA